jgi:hypothetical protein
MTMNPAIIEMFLRSAGAPPALIDILRLIQAEGFKAFTCQPIATNDQRVAFLVTASGPTSRVKATIELEGVNHAILAKLGPVSPPALHGSV